jgi:hypothetical protein
VSKSTYSWARTPGFRNLNDIPRDGTYVSVLLSRRRTSPACCRALALPLDVRRPHEITMQEGSALAEYRFAGRYHGLYYVDLRVDFGRRRPTAAMLRRAGILLTRLRLPARLVSGPARC